jgi:excisionase family DNA binding protein
MRHVLQLQALLQSALQAVVPVSQSPEPEAPSSARGAGDLLTAQEVAAKLGISDKTVYRHAKEGRIPYVRIQSSLRFRPSEIEDWLASKSFQPASLRKTPPAGKVTTRSSSRR